MRLICQLQEDLRLESLQHLHHDLSALTAASCVTQGTKRKPLRSPALLNLDMDKLIAAYRSGIAPYTLALQFGIDRETVAKRLRDAGFMG